MDPILMTNMLGLFHNTDRLTKKAVNCIFATLKV